jgi:hypothetical protein
MKREFIKAGNVILRLADIERVDIAEIECGRLTVFYDGGQALVAQDFDAFEILMLLHPAAIEGRRLRWAKHAWAFHNLVAHPLMQLMVWAGFKKQAIWLHDVTVPKPFGIRTVTGEALR